jgi:N-methylhydantoinase A
VVLNVSGQLPKSKLEAEFAALEDRARREFTAERWKGKPQLRRTLDVRYRGQGFELNVSYSPFLIADFHAEHQRRYGYSHPDRDVEIVTLRLRASIAAPNVQLRAAETRSQVPAEQAGVIFSGKPLPTAILTRSSLAVNRSFAGPAVVTEYSATTVVPPRWTGCVDSAGNLVLQHKK